MRRDRQPVAGAQRAPVDAAETAGSRILFAPKQANARDRFLTVIQLADGDAAPNGTV